MIFIIPFYPLYLKSKITEDGIRKYSVMVIVQRLLSKKINYLKDIIPSNLKNTSF